ncbi:MAG: MCE family protein [Desulfobacteraceae bacterium]|nr:MAG: MCE family protein [Desulfobacteraceae bacterium]
MKANFFKIGLFVISALAVAVAAVIILGAGALFRSEIIVESYFQESVQGLGEGSLLTFRGVPIGHVSSITLTANAYRTDHRYAMVRASVMTEMFQLKGEESEALKKEIAGGLRVRLALQGLTGAYYLEADYADPESNPPLPIDWDPDYPYIPAVPSTVTRLSEALDGILKNLEQINIQGITSNLEKSLSTLSSVMEKGNVEQIGQEARNLLSELRETNRQISKVFAGDVESSLNQLEATFKRLSGLLSGQERDIEETVNNFRAASQNLKEVTENLKRNPSQLLFGQPPARAR